MRYVPLVTLVLGTTAGGLLLGSVVVAVWYAVSGFEEMRAAVVLGGAGLAGVAVLSTPIRRWLPERACQVSSARMHDPPGQAAFRWGLSLGTGVSTFVVTPAMYALLAVACGQARPLAALAVCAFYGTCRGAAIAFFAVVRSRQRHLSTALRSPGSGLEPMLRIPVTLAVLLAALTATLL